MEASKPVMLECSQVVCNSAMSPRSPRMLVYVMCMHHAGLCHAGLVSREEYDKPVMLEYSQGDRISGKVTRSDIISFDS